jgi:hypothetical protein
MITVVIWFEIKIVEAILSINFEGEFFFPLLWNGFGEWEAMGGILRPEKYKQHCECSLPENKKDGRTAIKDGEL